MEQRNKKSVKINSSDSLDKIVLEYAPGLRRYIRSHVPVREDAEDILQEVFYQLARTTEDESRGVDKMASWLYRVARNMVLNFYRKKHEITFGALYDEDETACIEISQVLFCDDADSPDNMILRKLVWQELEIALAELPSDQSEMFCLTVFDCVPVKDISLATGIPVATLLSRKHYAVKYLRKKFKDLYDELLG